MSLKRSYATEADVPPERKADYVLKDGRYVLDVEGFENIESVLAKNSELLGKVSGHAAELTAKQGEIDRLTGELANARTSSLPRGHKAVPNADADLLEAMKAEGVTTADQFKTLKTEHSTLTKTVAAQTRRQRFGEVGKKLKWNDDTPDVLEVVPNLPDIEDRDVTVNGKVEKVPHAKLVTKNASGQEEVSYRPFGEWFAEAYPALHRSVQASSGVRVPGSTGGGGSPAGQKDVVGDFIKERDAAAAARPNPFTKPQQVANA